MGATAKVSSAEVNHGSGCHPGIGRKHESPVQGGCIVAEATSALARVRAHLCSSPQAVRPGVRPPIQGRKASGEACYVAWKQAPIVEADSIDGKLKAKHSIYDHCR